MTAWRMLRRADGRLVAGAAAVAVLATIVTAAGTAGRDNAPRSAGPATSSAANSSPPIASASPPAAPTAATPSSAGFNPLTNDWTTVGGKSSGARLGNHGTVIKHRTIAASGTGNTGIFGSSFTAEYNDITADEDGVDFIGNGPFLVQYNRLHRDGTQFGDAHHDGIQSWVGKDVTIRRNWIDGWETSAILIKTDVGPISNVLIEENYLGNLSGGWSLYVVDAATGFGRPTFVDVINNRFRSANGTIASGSEWGSQATFCHTRAQRQAAIDGGNADAAGWIVWSGNRWADGPLAGHEIAPPEPAVWL
ncbi:MAG: hypothetical protein QOG49_487 [Frankiaceae bacterium]|nr:hypothetical protein [Frankiaceae bacterium]